jgi:hypothetical protein
METTEVSQWSSRAEAKEPAAHLRAGPGLDRDGDLASMIVRRTNAAATRTSARVPIAQRPDNG